MGKREKQTVSRRKFIVGASTMLAGAAVAGSLVGCTSAGEEPVPVTEETFLRGGELKPVVCNMCFNSCNLLARVVDGVVVEIKGDARSPIGWGHVCPKGAAGIMQLYDKDRITKPLIRTNPEKGLGIDPMWEEITLDEAFTILTDKLKTTAESDNKLVNVLTLVTCFNLRFTTQQFVGATGCTPVLLGADICGAAIHTISDIFTGGGNSLPDYSNNKYLIQFGTQAGLSTRHGTNSTAKLYAEARKNGARLINFDPHMSNGAELADLWVPIRPGTDGAAAMSLAYVLVHETGKIDTDFLANRTNGPALVDLSTGRIVRAQPTGELSVGKALYMDLADNTIKPYDECGQPALEGTFEYEGRQCSTGFTLYKESLLKWTPEYQEAITTVPAATIRQIAEEYGTAARIGETIEVEGVTLPHRPACVDFFSGITRHKHASLSCWSIQNLNMLVGAFYAYGGHYAFSPACNGFADAGFVQWRPSIWEPDGFIENCGIVTAFPSSIYRPFYETDLAPLPDQTFTQFMPLGVDRHFGYISQVKPDYYHTTQAKIAICAASSPLTNWGSHDEMAEFLLTYEHITAINLYLDDSSDFYDLFIPQATYLERYDPMPHFFLNHRTSSTMEIPWAVTLRQPVIPPIDNAPGAFEIASEVINRLGKNAEFAEGMNSFYRIKEEYAVQTDKKIETVDFVNSINQSLLGEQYTVEWFQENSVFTAPRQLDEVFIWANDAPGKIPLYWDFMLEAKEKIQAQAAAHNIPWEFEDFQALPEWKPCPDFEISDPEFDVFPVYWTNSLNTDNFQVQNAWLSERTELSELTGFGIIMNSATAQKKGLASGDDIRLTGKNGASVEGRLIVGETVHPEVIQVLGGHYSADSGRRSIAKGKGVAINKLIPSFDVSRWDHTSAAFDQCVRVKIEKI